MLMVELGTADVVNGGMGECGDWRAGNFLLETFEKKDKPQRRKEM